MSGVSAEVRRHPIDKQGIKVWTKRQAKNLRGLVGKMQLRYPIFRVVLISSTNKQNTNPHKILEKQQKIIVTVTNVVKI